ncbi:MAG: site-specific DNA-methyltransferase [Gammaproteobacteria bacterium]|nr:site-specific DNA-methyltransferase [Gammaproteobacteria bacterium]MDE0302310.1 site-specific DNA-methyltransferase [Gammaproteobacteria bacterium]MDE0611625.1 site-specific DNA-methyltransferase [Gammaproteobacteria bacterium]
MNQRLVSDPETQSAPSLDIYFGDNLSILRGFAKETFNLIYIDPPFNTGKTQTRKRLKTTRDVNGDRVGFQGKRYKTTQLGSLEFPDSFTDYLFFLEPRLLEAHRLLSPTGSFFFHIDYREVHYCKVLLDQIFGRECFINEIIWSYDYGARSKKRWSAKHDNILWYAKNPDDYTYRYDDIDRIPYMAPGLVGPEKAAKGKTPTDTWWQTIVSPNGKEKTGYPTQKPLAILNRIVNVHSNPGDWVLDFFAGSGTTGEAAIKAGRNAVLIDNHSEAIKVMIKRLAFAKPDLHSEELVQQELPELDLAKTA